MRRVVVLLFLLAATAYAPVSIVDLWNVFASEARDWVMMRKALVPGTYDAAQRRQWEKVRHAWHEIDVAVRNE